MSDDGKTRIRFAEKADAAVIARIHMTSRSATMPYLPPQKRSHEQVTRWVRDVLLRQCRTWVAMRDAEIMGYAALDQVRHSAAPSDERLVHLYRDGDACKRPRAACGDGDADRASDAIMPILLYIMYIIGTQHCALPSRWGHRPLAPAE